MKNPDTRYNYEGNKSAGFSSMTMGSTANTFSIKETRQSNTLQGVSNVNLPM
jgi:hypothetical protein